MINGNLRRAFPYRLILSVLMGAVLLYLIANFVMQAGERLDLRGKLHRIEQDIAAAEKANSELKARLDYVSSDAAAEVLLFKTHDITHIVCRNSGGSGAYAKIEAARKLGLPVIMVARP